MHTHRKEYTLGIVAALLSAFLFGVTPILARISYTGGANAAMLTFLRSALAIPVLFVIMFVKKIPFSLNKKEFTALLFSGVFGTAATTLLLYGSYAYIDVGMATALHFLYPLFITLVGILFFSEKMGVFGAAAVITGIGGVFFLVDFRGSKSLLGIVLSIISAATYALYMLCVQHTELKKMHYIKLGFYYAVVNAIVAGGYGLFAGQLNFSMTGFAWGIVFALAMLIAVGGVILLNYSIVKIGASTASILCVLEPICSVAFGVWFLNEKMTVFKVIGFLLVIISVVLSTKSGTAKEKPLHKRRHN